MEAKGLDGGAAAHPGSQRCGYNPLQQRCGGVGGPSTVAAPAAASPTNPANAADSAKDGDEPAWICLQGPDRFSVHLRKARACLAIGGKEGDPVLAAGDGRFCAGSGLRIMATPSSSSIGGDCLRSTTRLYYHEDQVVRHENCRNGLDRCRPRAVAFRDSQTRQADRPSNSCQRVEQGLIPEINSG